MFLIAATFVQEHVFKLLILWLFVVLPQQFVLCRHRGQFFLSVNTSKELLEVYSLVSVQTSLSFRTLAANPKNQFQIGTIFYNRETL